MWTARLCQATTWLFYQAVSGNNLAVLPGCARQQPGCSTRQCQATALLCSVHSFISALWPIYVLKCLQKCLAQISDDNDDDNIKPHDKLLTLSSAAKYNTKIFYLKQKLYNKLICAFLSTSLYVSKRGAY